MLITLHAEEYTGKIMDKLMKEENDTGTDPAHQTAFQKLAVYVESALILCPTEVTTMSKLCQMYRDWLTDEGVGEPAAVCRSYILKARNISHFGNLSCFHRPHFEAE